MRYLLAAALLLTALFTLAAIAQPVGSITRIQGHADSVAGEAVRPLAVGADVEAGDVLRTGDRARLQVRFADGTKVVLGEDAHLTVEAFAYDGHAGTARLAVDGGAFLLDSGAIAKLPGRPLTVKLPNAVVGLRGTRFWGGPLDGPWNLLLFEGAITVSTAAGTAELTTPGTGTTLAGASAPPSSPLQWSDERIARAVATVAFER
jgi:hypothetical protein